MPQLIFAFRFFEFRDFECHITFLCQYSSGLLLGGRVKERLRNSDLGGEVAVELKHVVFQPSHTKEIQNY